MPIGSPSRRTTGIVAAAALAGSAILIAVCVRWNDGRAPSRSGEIRIVGGASPTPSTSSALPQPLPTVTSKQTQSTEEMTAALVKRFPAIREAQVVCEGECKLVAALGDQSLGQTPFDGNLERYLAEQGYGPSGSLIVDQPGDNDTMLTIIVHPLDTGALKGKPVRESFEKRVNANGVP